MNARLILIDGMPGSGKSTLAQELGCVFPASHVYLENRGANPLHAFAPGEDVAAFADAARLSPAEVADRSLQRWRAFANDEDLGLHIAESFPFQSGVRVLYQMNAPVGLIRDYFAEIQEIARVIGSRLIFLTSGDVAYELNRIVDLRGHQWTAQVAAFIEATAWSRDRGLKGMEAVWTFILEYDSLVADLLPVWTLPTLLLPGGSRFDRSAVEQATNWVGA